MPYNYDTYSWADDVLTMSTWRDNPQKRRAWYNSEHTTSQNFRHSPNKRQSARKLDIWEDKNAKKWKINKMTLWQLTLAITQLEGGWKCYGQEAKVISLKKALAKLEGNGV